MPRLCDVMKMVVQPANLAKFDRFLRRNYLSTIHGDSDSDMTTLVWPLVITHKPKCGDDVMRGVDGRGSRSNAIKVEHASTPRHEKTHHHSSAVKPPKAVSISCLLVPRRQPISVLVPSDRPAMHRAKLRTPRPPRSNYSQSVEGGAPCTGLGQQGPSHAGRARVGERGRAL